MHRFFNDPQKHAQGLVQMGVIQYDVILIIEYNSNVNKTFYFCRSLIQSSQCRQIAAVRYSSMEFRRFSFSLYAFSVNNTNNKETIMLLLWLAY